MELSTHFMAYVQTSLLSQILSPVSIFHLNYVQLLEMAFYYSSAEQVTCTSLQCLYIYNPVYLQFTIFTIYNIYNLHSTILHTLECVYWLGDIDKSDIICVYG